MTRSSGQQETLELISRYVDGELEGDEAQRFLGLLEADPSMDRVLYANLFVDFMVRKGVQADKATAFVPSFESHDDRFFADLIRMEKDAPPVSPESPQPVRPRSWRRWIPPAPAVIASIALLLFLGVGLIVETSKKAKIDAAYQFRPIARIVEAVDAEWDASHEQFKVGEEIGRDKLVLKSGMVQIEFFRGARVILTGPVEFVLNNENKSFCQRGRLSAFVPPSARGFEVTTPFSTVVDFGTAFSVEVTDASTEVHVFQGMVEVNRIASAALRLTDGLAARLSYKGETEHKPADPDAFVSETSFLGHVAKHRQRRRAEREIVENRLAGDPSLLFRLHAGMPGIVGCTKTPGSLPGLEAFAFKKTSDRIELSLPGTFQNLTLLAVVKIKKIGRFSNTLFLGEAFYETPGHFLWQIDQSGMSQFHVRGETSHTACDVARSVTRKDWNTWTVLAVVADAENRAVRHYKDGRLIGALPWTPTGPLRIDRATIGNETADPNKASPRYLNGAVEDFCIFSRVLTDGEILEYAGVPVQ